MTSLERFKGIEACGTAMTLLLPRLAKKGNLRDEQDAAELVKMWDELTLGGEPGPRLRAIAGLPPMEST